MLCCLVSFFSSDLVCGFLVPQNPKPSSNTPSRLSTRLDLFVMCQLLSLLHAEEESIVRLTCSALEDLWFTSPNLHAANSCLEEIVAAVNFDEPIRNGVLLERLLGQLPTNAEARARVYVDGIFCKLSSILNISYVASPVAAKPSTFNDFDTRARKLLPVLYALKPFVKKLPHLVFPHLSKILPVLSTMDISKHHLVVLRLLLDILCDVVGHQKSIIAANVNHLTLQVAQLESQRQQKAGKNNIDALDARLVDIKQQLASCRDPGLPAHFEAELVKSFMQGALKLSDHTRWTSFEEIGRATQAFCTIVDCNRTASSVAHLLKVFVHYVAVLKSYIDRPTQERAGWIPRTLVVAGCVVRFFDLASVKPADLVAADAGLATQALEAKQSFFVYCLAHFANNNQDRIKCSALHALGSMFVREPSLMLNKVAVRLMRKCLGRNEPQTHQLQVLNNLHEHFVAEEADLIARTSDESLHSGSVELVSDTSTCIMHAFHQLILEASLSPVQKVREQAVLLIKIILHRGLTASYRCMPFLLAQQCKADLIADKALRILEGIHQREASQFTPDVLWEGIEKGFGMCTSAKDLPLEAFASAFRLLASNEKERANKMVRRFLVLAMKPFEQIEHNDAAAGVEDNGRKEGSLEFKHFVAKLLAQLPFQSMDSVLMLIKMVQDRATTLGGSCIEGLGRSLAAVDDTRGICAQSRLA